MAPSAYQLAYTQPNSYAYAPWTIASPYTTSSLYSSGYTTAANGYSTTPQLSSAALQQSQIVPYTTTAQGTYLLTPSQLQQLNSFYAQSPTAAAAVQPVSYTTATPAGVQKIAATAAAAPASTVVTPTTASFYSPAPASQSYQQSPTFRKCSIWRHSKARHLLGTCQFALFIRTLLIADFWTFFFFLKFSFEIFFSKIFFKIFCF